MCKVALLLLQVAISIAPAPDASERLLHPVPPSACRPSSNEIVVCGRDADTYRLPKTGTTPEATGLPKAEWRLFGVTRIDVHGTQRTLASGSAPAAMVTVKLPF